MTHSFRQAGNTTVEFAIIGLWFLIVLFGVLEFGRLLFAWNTMSESVRRAVRVAVVCPVNDPKIVQAALFGGNTDSTILSGLNVGNLQVSYLDASNIVVPDPVINFTSIENVRVSIVGYQHALLIPLFQQTITAPVFSATLPRESLGVSPEGVQCL